MAFVLCPWIGFGQSGAARPGVGAQCCPEKRHTGFGKRPSRVPFRGFLTCSRFELTAYSGMGGHAFWKFCVLADYEGAAALGVSAVGLQIWFRSAKSAI